MSSQLATLTCFFFIFYLFRVDREKNNDVSGAVWIPLIWMFLAGSRFASQWLNLDTPEGESLVLYSEGSPLDRNVFLGLILAGIWVLRQRNLDWSGIFTRNAWIWLFFLFAAISVCWSDDPFVSIKRWFKGIGNIVMALVILTEKRPYEALGFVLRRLGFMLIPLSILFIKFYPDLGRSYHMGKPMFTGVTFQKNSLGQLCLMLGVYFCWELVLSPLRVLGSKKPTHYAIYLIIFAMILWLLHMAQSATSNACMLITVCLLLFCRLPALIKRPHRIFSIGIAFIAFLILLEKIFDIKAVFIRMLGRKPDLTDRTPVWEMVLDLTPNPLIGAGYESFWSGERLIQIWKRMGFSSGGIIQAHNGYIEIYLSLGILGLALLIASIISGLGKARKQLETEYAYSVLRIALIIIVAITNYTEATYKPVNNYFVLLLISIMEVPVRKKPIKLEYFKKSKTRVHTINHAKGISHGK